MITNDVLVQNAREDLAALRKAVDSEDLSRSTMRQTVAPILRRWIVYGDLVDVFNILGKQLLVEAECAGFDVSGGIPEGLCVSIGVKFQNIEFGSFSFVDTLSDVSEPPWLTKQTVVLGRYKNQKVLLWRNDASKERFTISRERLVKLVADKLGAAHSERAPSGVTATTPPELRILDAIGFVTWPNGTSAMRLRVGDGTITNTVEIYAEGSLHPPTGKPSQELEGAFLLLYSIAKDLAKSPAIVAALG